MDSFCFVILGRSAIIAAIVVFVAVILDKFGLFEFLQYKGPQPLSKWAQCQFCITFWLSLPLCIAGYFINPDIAWAGVPIVVSVIGRSIL